MEFLNLLDPISTRARLTCLLVCSQSDCSRRQFLYLLVDLTSSSSPLPGRQNCRPWDQQRPLWIARCFRAVRDRRPVPCLRRHCGSSEGCCRPSRRTMRCCEIASSLDCWQRLASWEPLNCTSILAGPLQISVVRPEAPPMPLAVSRAW